MERVVHILTESKFAFPLWNFAIFLLAFFYRRGLVRAISRALRVFENHGLEDELVSRSDQPAAIVFVGAAILPFFAFLEGVIAGRLERIVEVVVLFYLLKLATIFFDLFVFKWYFGQYKNFTLPAIFRTVTITLIYAVFVLVLIQFSIGVNILPILATSTVMTAVLGLALQDTLKNLFAGLSLSMEKSIHIGDWVTFQADAGLTTTGLVLEIGWRTTRLETLDGNIVRLPNAVLTNSRVTNYSQPSPSYSRSVDIPVPRFAQVDEVVTALTQSAHNVEGVSQSPHAEVYPVGTTIDSVTYRVKFWMDDFRSGEAIAGDIIRNAIMQLETLRIDKEKPKPALPEISPDKTSPKDKLPLEDKQSSKDKPSISKVSRSSKS